MLKFDHIAKIFFVDIIILVEGETDMYFFSHYIEYLKTLPERSNRIHNYEIITISGK
jgi:predicted ATP-dependent endonuclease of OLD family